MYKNQKYIIFGLDTVAVFASILIASLLRFGAFSKILLIRSDKSNVLAIIILYGSYLLADALYYSKVPIGHRSVWQNLKISCLINLIMMVMVSLVLYIVQLGEDFSRLFFLYFFVSNFILMFSGRMFAKFLVLKYFRTRKKRLVVFANESNALKVLNKLVNSKLYDYEIVGIVLKNNDAQSAFYKVERNKMTQKTYLSNEEIKTMDFLQKDAVDEALLSLPECSHVEIKRLIELLESMGIDSHLTMNTFSLGVRELSVENFGMYHVLTFSPREFDEHELLAKRLLDIAGGLVGCVLCVIVGIFVAPAIYIEDPGPVIFKQKRVGRNGRQFGIYKFRSMYQDAEERKKELMKQNEMSGLMFKMKNDPRITKVGRFIRKTSLDEFPQFFNVLMGDMSLVGTRPPTVAEFEQYSPHHKRRLSLKPGITGLWQVSGRSDITDFEDVVNLDLEYIDNWTFWSDIRILFMTVWVVLTGRGSE